eukprot:jgi/Mesvir1/16715/Mv15106-RA.1
MSGPSRFLGRRTSCNSLTSFQQSSGSSLSLAIDHGGSNTHAKVYSTQRKDNHPGIVEIREYTLKPEGFKPFLELTAKFRDLRQSLNPGWRVFLTCDTGGVLNKVTHMYAFDSMTQRDQVRAALAGHDGWQQQYINAVRPHVAAQESKIMMEMGDCLAVAGSPGVRNYQPKPSPSPGLYEFRTYQLLPGHDMVPKVRELFSAGLPAKLAAYPQGQELVTLMYSVRA